MVKTVKATYAAGSLALAEPLPLRDGETVEVTVTSAPATDRPEDVIRATSGAWADLLDCEEFERAVYERRHHQRAPVSGASVRGIY
jgi:predicted DNA-binding antitoxin AbrB/MazE fold protein